MKRNICIVTGSRAEYGLLYWLIKRVHEDEDLHLQLVVTGMHLSQEFGNTIDDITRDGFPVAQKVGMLLSADDGASIAKSMGLGMIGFAQAYEGLEPDMIIVLGDRFEILSAVSAAMPFRIPVVHLHGGESTEGCIDELIRHAITKMSHLHFVSTEPYRERVLQMGEREEHVYTVGALALESIDKTKFMKRDELCRELDISRNDKLGVVTYHPVTLEGDVADEQICELLKAVDRFQDISWIFSMPNADSGGRVIAKRVFEYVSHHADRSKVFTSLGQRRYYSLLKHASVMVGNSSSGILEAPAFRLPVVNIGDRQRGRIRAKNVIDVKACDADDIEMGIRRALAMQDDGTMNDFANPYVRGMASELILNVIKTVQLDETLLKKRFCDR